jgi:MFS transporter, FHS family, L-fucose permease
MGVGGGAWYPPAQAALADKASTRRSYLVPVSGYIAMTIYAVGLVIDQAVKGGFRFRNVHDTERLKNAYPEVDESGLYAHQQTPPAKNSSVDEKGSSEYVEGART